METFVQFILLFSLVKYCLKAAIAGRLGYILLFSVAAGGIAVCLYPIIIHASPNIVAEILKNPGLVADGILFTTIESVAGIMLSVKLLDFYFLPKEKRTGWMRVLRFVPGFMYILSIAYLEILFVSTRVGSDFLLSSLLFALLLAVSVFVTACLFKFLVRSESQKLELKIIINMVILLLGLMVNSMVSDYNISAASAVIEWKALVCLVILGIVSAMTGYLLFRRKNRQIR